MENLLKKIQAKKAIVGIVGVGYVGEALGVSIADAGYKVLGFEIDQARIKLLNNRLKGKIEVKSDKQLLKNCDIICICVPTPLDKEGKPDYSILKDAVSEVSLKLQKKQLVISESSVPPGTSRNLILPILEDSGLKIETDFFLGYSPERVDPGNNQYKVKNIPKVVSGIGEKSLKLTSLFYKEIVETIIPVSSCEAAEMTKVLENVFRLINISLINEIADYTGSMGINIWEVISAAATKPFGFMAHYPGAGAGGYCIPVLPEFLLENALNKNINLPLVKMALEANKKQPEKVATLAIKLLNGKAHNKNGNGNKPQALLVGISYKEGLSDTRESVALKIWKNLEKEGVKVQYHDPYVLEQNGINSINLNSDDLSKIDVIILTTAHKNISYETLISTNKPLLDTRGALNGYNRANIIHL